MISEVQWKKVLDEIRDGANPKQVAARLGVCYETVRIRARRAGIPAQSMLERWSRNRERMRQIAETSQQGVQFAMEQFDVKRSYVYSCRKRFPLPGGYDAEHHYPASFRKAAVAASKKKGCKATAREFDIPYGTLTRWRGELGACPRRQRYPPQKEIVAFVRSLGGGSEAYKTAAAKYGLHVNTVRIYCRRENL